MIMINLILMEKMLVMHTITPRRTGLNQMRGLLFGLLLSGVVCLPMAHADSAPSVAQSPSSSPNPAQTPTAWSVPPAFLAGMAAIAQGDNAAVQTALTALGDNPLATYLQFRYLMDVAGQNVPAVRDFLQAHPDYIFSQNLKSRLLTRLNRQKNFTDYQTIEALPPALKATPTRLCQSWQAAEQTATLTPEQIAAAEQLWAEGRSQPEACNPIFAWLKTKGNLNAALYAQRIRVSLAEGNTTLADYLVREAQKQKITGLNSLVTQWKTAQADPAAVLQAALASHPAIKAADEDQQALWTQAFIWLAKSNPQTADTLWTSNPAHWGLSTDAQAKITQLIALKAAYTRLPQAYGWLMALPASAQNQETQTWAARAALRSEDWPNLKVAIAAMPVDLSQTPEWQYWWARADAKLGDNEGAKARWQALTLTPDYYGFLAADRLDIAYPWPKIPPLPTLDTTAVQQNPMVQLAFYLRAADLPDDARRAFSAALDDIPAAQIPALTLLAEQVGWHDRVSIAIARMKKQDDPTWFAARFPTPWQPIVDAKAQAQGVASNWLYAVIRRESLFMSDVGSGAGAQGLMQLMPTTADWINRKAGLGLTGMNLHDPQTSITLGSAYLSYLNGRYAGQMPLAIAAYNAGPGRVKQWLPENRALPGDVWVDTILFDETRNYVRAVLSATLIYAWREAGAAPKPASLPADNLLALLGPVAPLNPPAPSATDTAQPVADTKAPPATQAKTMPASEPAAITVSADSP
ncbi:MAG TPA: transglycosylase SLT domain-containing protein [Halothiobacillus sp.]|nr:transglycosylase SLT domain-containing protein [Halothiobacillus sp.]